MIFFLLACPTTDPEPEKAQQAEPVAEEAPKEGEEADAPEEGEKPEAAKEGEAAE